MEETPSSLSLPWERQFPAFPKKEIRLADNLAKVQMLQ